MEEIEKIKHIIDKYYNLQDSLIELKDDSLLDDKLQDILSYTNKKIQHLTRQIQKIKNG